MFINDAIAPIANRVLRKLGIREEKSNTVMDFPHSFYNGKVGTEDFTTLLFNMCKLTDKVVTEGEVNSITYNNNGSLTVFEKKNIVWLTFEDFPGLYHVRSDDANGATDLLCVIAEDLNLEGLVFKAGTYGAVASLSSEGGQFTTAISLQTETITPIDPKYLPGPKVIDLDKYGSPTTVTGILWELLGAGGGKRADVDIGSLFDDLKTDSPVRVRFSYLSGSEFMTIAVDGVTIVRTAKRVAQLCFSCVIAQGSVISSVAVTIAPSGYITMSVTVA